ncbi:serine/threonine-protein kinase [Pendulispora rubella]
MANPSPNDPWIGAVLADRYRLTRSLGSGGMGSVYAATSLETGQSVAIKVLHREFLSDAGVLSRFLEEGRTCQKLVHPNIVRVFGTGHARVDGASQVHAELPFLVMELLEGVPLSAYTKNGGRVPLTQAVPIVQAVLFGLAAAHAEGIVHRDLKPENVFLAREPNGQFIVKILDFGIAKVMDEAGGMGKKTSTGMLLGTPAYMSPEQIKNSKDVDPRSDLFSLGVLFYEMLAGAPAFPAPNEFAKLSAVLTTEPEPIERIDPKLAFLTPFIAQSIAKDRQQRFQSAAAMMHALAAVLGHDSGTAPQAGPGGSHSRAQAQPLSQLPEVPFTATARVAQTPFTGGVPPRLSEKPPSIVASEAIISASPIPMPAQAGVAPHAEPGVGTLASAGAGISDARRRLLDMPISSSDTLASARGNQHPAHEPPPQVVLVAPSSGSGALSSGDSRGVAPWVVAALVAAALLAGFILGFAVARAM